MHVYRVEPMLNNKLTRIGSKSTKPGLSSFILPSTTDTDTDTDTNTDTTPYSTGVATGKSYLQDLIVGWGRGVSCRDFHDSSTTLSCDVQSPEVSHDAPSMELINSKLRIRLFATAGMRLVDAETVAKPFYLGIEAAIKEHRNLDFKCETLNGDDEGFFGILAADHLVRKALLTTAAAATATNPSLTVTVGSLDLGGGSGQIAIPLKKHNSSANHPTPTITPSDFFITSYLGYGVNAMREALLEHLMRANKSENPCAFVGWTIDYKIGDGKLVGTGDARACSKLIKGMNQWDKTSIDRSIFHPAISESTTWVAMSLYFYALDCVREIALNPILGGERAKQNAPCDKKSAKSELTYSTIFARSLRSA